MADEDGTEVTIEVPPADDTPEVTQTVIVADTPDDPADDSATVTELDTEHRLTVIEEQVNQIVNRLSAVEVTAQVAQISADVVSDQIAEVAEAVPDVSAEVAAEVVEETEIVENDEGEQVLDAPDPSPRSSNAHFLFADHPFRDRRRD